MDLFEFTFSMVSGIAIGLLLALLVHGITADVGTTLGDNRPFVLYCDSGMPQPLSLDYDAYKGQFFVIVNCTSSMGGDLQ